jgi:hypothetical protein
MHQNIQLRLVILFYNPEALKVLEVLMEQAYKNRNA